MNRSHLTASELERVMYVNGETERLTLLESEAADADELQDELEVAERQVEEAEADLETLRADIRELADASELTADELRSRLKELI